MSQLASFIFLADFSHHEERTGGAVSAIPASIANVTFCEIAMQSIVNLWHTMLISSITLMIIMVIVDHKTCSSLKDWCRGHAPKAFWAAVPWKYIDLQFTCDIHPSNDWPALCFLNLSLECDAKREAKHKLSPSSIIPPMSPSPAKLCAKRSSCFFSGIFPQVQVDIGEM